MKKKVIMIRCAKLLCLVLCVMLLCGLAGDFCRYYDYNVTKLAGFYAEPEDTLDVVFLGASDVFTGFSSAYAYELYGFTSYPYAQDASPMVLYRSQLTEVLKHQNPKWIVVEINGALYDDPSMHTDGGALRRYLNNIPYSMNRIRTIMELVPAQERYFYFFPLAKSHSNWKSIPEQGQWVRDYYDVKWNGSKLKGNVTSISEFEAPAMMDVAGDTSTAPLEPVSEKHLRSFLEFCREKGLENVLFVRFPHIISTEEGYTRFRRGNEAERIIREYGYSFVNLEREGEAIGLDYTADFYNDDHLNIAGQKKLTAYLGKLLAEDYGVGPTRLTEKQRRNWEEAAEYNRLFYSYCEDCLENGESGARFESGELLSILEARK